MRCSNCNSDVTDGIKFCPYCGNPMIPQQQPQQPQQAQYQQPNQGQYQQPNQGQYQQPNQGQYQQPHQGQYQPAYRQQQPQRPQNPRLNFVDAISIASSRLTETDGRSRRSEFWWWYLAIAVGTIVISIIPYVSAFSQLISLGFLYAITIRRLNDVPAPEWFGKVYIGCWLAGSIMIAIYNLGFVYYVRFFEEFIYSFGSSNFTTLMGLVYIAEAVVGIIGLYFFTKDSNPEIDPIHGPSPKYTL